MVKKKGVELSLVVQYFTAVCQCRFDKIFQIVQICDVFISVFLFYVLEEFLDLISSIFGGQVFAGVRLHSL